VAWPSRTRVKKALIRSPASARPPDPSWTAAPARHGYLSCCRDGHFTLPLRPRSPTPFGITDEAVNRATLPPAELADWGEADAALVRPDANLESLGKSGHAKTACAHRREHVQSTP